jgi:hypothetical protein
MVRPKTTAATLSPRTGHHFRVSVGLPGLGAFQRAGSLSGIGYAYDGGGLALAWSADRGGSPGPKCQQADTNRVGQAADLRGAVRHAGCSRSIPSAAPRTER